MNIRITPDSFFVFDLDDTLFQEVDYLRSAYRAIAAGVSPEKAEDIYEEMFSRYQLKENVFQWLVSSFGNTVPELTLEKLLKDYREHTPEINLARETSEFLQRLRQRKVPMGLITDGRSITQRNKLNALGISDYFVDIIISEEFGSQKPDERNYLFFENKYPGKDFIFIADNTTKDFIVPERLGWTSICIKDAGQNIHAQNLELFPNHEYLVTSFKDINLV